MQPAPAPRSARAARLPADERRQQVLDAAIRAFARKGYAGASTQAIAASIGVGEPTLYRYFASKRELFLAAYDRCSTELLERWRALAAESASPLEAIGKIGDWYVQQLRARPDDLLLRYHSLSHADDEEIGARVRANYRETLAFLEELYAQARARGEIAASADPRAQAWMLLALGAVLDQAQLLDLGDELPPEVLAPLVALVKPPLARPR
jgi:AcrR family transcriptional regulator